MGRLKNFLMGEEEAGRFVFPEPPDYPDEAEYYGTGLTWAEAREMLDGAPPAPKWTDKQLNDLERRYYKPIKKQDFKPFELDEIPF